MTDETRLNLQLDCDCLFDSKTEQYVTSFLVSSPNFVPEIQTTKH